MSLSFERVSFRYRRASQAVFVDFFWKIPNGRTVLLGPNGAGKSTLLALGADMLRPDKGIVSYRTLQTTRRSDRAAYRRAVGWMPQQVRAVPGLTAREQVAYAGWLKGLSRSRSWLAAARALDRVGLSELAGRKTSSLSGGQLRRVGLAQALVHEAEVLLLDEPTAGLDPAQRARFREILAELPDELPVVVSTHQVDDLSELFDIVAVIENGTIRFEGEVSVFMDLAPQGVTERRAEAAYTSIIPRER